ncbi:MAG: hypothetical protein SF123_11745 [Chloroflexota bacterium]|nr:hypothetical protein [Chloroflexota bacterium]
MRTWTLWIVTWGVTVIGLMILLGPGLAVLLIAAIVPYVLVTFVVREQQVSQTRQCVERYVQIRRHSPNTG